MSLLWNPLEKENVKNPYGMYRELRNNSPIHKAKTGEWVITRHKDIKRILLDKRFLTGNRIDWIDRVVQRSKDKKIDISAMSSIIDNFLIFKNDPEHNYWRKSLINIWPAEDTLVETISNTLVDLFRSLEFEFDFVQDFSRPLAARVIGEILGLKQQETEKIVSDGVQIVGVTDLMLSLREIKSINESSVRLMAFFSNKFKNINTGEMSGLIYRLALDPELNRIDPNFGKRISICAFLFMAGLETTSSSISLAIKSLIEKNEFERLPTHFDSKKGALELLRYDSPTQLLGRFATEEVDIQGQSIQNGDVVTLCLGSGNRDPEVFENPDELNFKRGTIPLLSFGVGAHYCLGDKIARLEMELSLNEILGKFSSIALVEEPEWRPHLTIRRLESMKVSVKYR